MTPDDSFKPVAAWAAAGRGGSTVQVRATLMRYAARLIERRTLLKTGQPLSMIAYASGFRDYTYFARAFGQRFGRTSTDRALRSKMAKQLFLEHATCLNK